MARNNFEDRDNCEAKLVIANFYFFNLKSGQQDKEISCEFCLIVFACSIKWLKIETWVVFHSKILSAKTMRLI